MNDEAESSPLWAKYIAHISVSQIRTHLRNPLRWAYEKLEKLPTTQSYAAEIGTTIHRHLEGAARGRVARDIDEISDKCVNHFLVWAGQHDIASKRKAVEMEIKYSLDDTLPPILGYVDLYLEEWDGAPAVIDHKTSKTRRYFLAEDQLKNDWQLLVYGAWVLQQTPKARGIWLCQLQYAYNNKRDVMRCVRAYVTLEYVKAKMRELADIVECGIITSIETYDKYGIHGFQRDKCESCNCSFGPNSCEFNKVCQNVATMEDYKVAYDKADTKNKFDVEEELKKQVANMFSDLTNNEEGDNMGSIGKVTTQDVIPPVNLANLMNKAREKFKGITNTWDRREAMTEAIMQTMTQRYPVPKCIVVLAPSHFLGGTIDPEYMPVITQLKERGYTVVVEVQL